MVTLSLLGVGQNHQPRFTNSVSGPSIMVILTQFLLISPKLSPFGLLPRVISPGLPVLPFEFHPGRNFDVNIFLSQNIFAPVSEICRKCLVFVTIWHTGPGVTADSRPFRCSGGKCKMFQTFVIIYYTILTTTKCCTFFNKKGGRFALFSWPSRNL